MFQRRGTYLQRLSKLYSDTKQSYESAKVTPAAANVTDLPELRDLRRDFQIQQDRLLAWGMHWTDVGAPYSAQGDVDIDKKIDQAGLGEVVASVMSEIKRLLEESGRLEHPERYEMKKSARGPGSSPVAQRRDWTSHEVMTGRALLEQLTTCIDVLYSLEESRRADEKGGDAKRMKHAHASLAADGTDYGPLYDHPLHIDFNSLEFSTYSPQAADPPPYDPAEGSVISRERSIAYFRQAACPVLVDFLRADCPPYVVGSAEDVFELHELGEKLCKDRSLSWCGHLRLLGFTVDPNGPRCAMVYALPEGHDHRTLQQHRTLASLLITSNNQEGSSPALEDRFRLAYNLALSIMGYFAQGETHQYINSSNILLIGSREHMHRPHLPKELRYPYLLQSCQDFLSRLQAEESFAATIYRHPDHDIHASEVVPAYDIYSLGLLLLEIGLWIPLQKLWKPKYDRRLFMERVQRIYAHKLASKCGSKYMRVVQKCLQAPTELQYRNNYEDAGAFLLQVAKDLLQCCALDEEGPPPISDIEIFELIIIEQMCKAEAKAAEEEKMPPKLADDIKPELPKRANSKRKAEAIQHSMQLAEKPLRKWSDVDIPQEDLDQWNTMVMPKLGKMLETALKDSPESSCSLSLMMFGSTPENAKTTICIQCAQINKVRDVLRKKFRPKKGWGVVLLNGEVRRSGTGRRRKPRRSGYGSSCSKYRGPKAMARRPLEQKYQERPTSGASIGAFKDAEHLPPVSFGGTILVDGEPYGMTVHHMLDLPSDDEEDEDDEIDTVRRSEQQQQQPARRAAAPRKMPGQFDTSADVRFMQSEEDLSRFSDLAISDEDFENNSDDDDDQSDASTIRPDYAIMDADGNEFWFLEDSPPELDDDDGSDASSSDEADADDAASIGDKTGIAPYSDDDLCVTQPAIDDVDDDFFPSEEDRDDDHLASHAFGYVFASSGIRRVVRGEMKHEVDWALIRIHEDRLKVENAITSQQKGTTIPPTTSSPRQGSRTSPQRSDPIPVLTTITPLSSLSGLRVHCRGRSSGFRRGRISQAMSLVKMHGRQSFSVSWCVEGGFGIPGDSGAWVYDPISGGLCGHVLAWGEKSKTAYIAPMEVLFEDIKGRLGARCVELPVPEGVRRRQVREDEGIGMGTTHTSGGDQDDVAAKLRDMRLDSNTNAAAAASGSGSTSAPGAPGGAGKTKQVVGVRPLVMAGAVS
ncbi:uncharacterized protein Z519_02926 [Cladophialophora bantiana CBS 173.52]|uniref:DUF7580 domain-containing protein n=1 Tax=Cladophialophora bantiana (strain ATCC 10958 / CBS 173.52 / CDC B-1940 / NIH 8579) TaxID=1442370 RepID=A0A0D2GBB5_CLAB1|nr:uncharacterized protein Z519_02926 [Cladophialophora bantiana CBS 173.52]KIW95862.1 hypothetical protein Z519_02926 [Cladophialophora bantiana CBS 173.52]